MAHLSLALLGPLHITLDGQSISSFAYSKARALLLYLAVEADRPQQRDSLVTLLWPDLPETAARTNLRQALASLRETLGDANASQPFLLVTRDTLQFNPNSDHALDIRDFEALLAACHAHPHRQLQRCRSCQARLAQAAALYRGDFLAEFSLADSRPFEEWELIKREGLHQRGLEALALLADYHERRGADALARQYAQRQIELDPWREEAHRHLMRILARAGQRAAALAQYETCRRVLAEALGVEPTPETQTLYAAIRAGNGPEPAPEAARRPVPQPAAPLVGRQAEQRELAERLENPACRLVTLTGPGGIGKTSLALVVASELADTFADGAAFIALAGLTSPAELLAGLLLALDFPRPAAAEPLAQLVAALRERELLLVLDNFDELLDPSGEAVKQLAALLRAAPKLALLVTSRERLGLQAEWVFALEGLAAPSRDAPLPETPAASEGFEAVRLFVERARQTQHRFVLDAGAAVTVARICQLVEGWPLAIELAAAQVGAYPVGVIAIDLEADLRGYATALHDVPERHRSLWAAFEYSWQRLAPEARAVLPRLAVFRGGFDLAAAEPVAAASPALLEALVTKSLLRAGPQPAATGLAQRFELHEMTRQYSLQKLAAAPDAAATRRGHAAYFLALAETAAPQLTGADQLAWLNRLEREHSNLRAALRWAMEASEAEMAGRLGSALWRFWWLHGHLVEGRAWLQRLAALDQAVSPAVLAGVYNGAGVLANDLGDYTDALACHAQALRLRRELNDALGVARSLGNLGNTHRQLGDKARSRACFVECLQIFRDLGHQWGIATTLLNLGVMSEDNALDEAEALYAESMALYRELGDQHGLSIAIGNLGEIALRKRAYSESRQRYAEYLAISQAVGDIPSLGHGLMMLGIVAMEDQQIPRGVRCLAAAARQREAAGVPILAAWQDEYQQHLALARAALGAAAFDAAWAEGAALPLDRALLLATG